MRLIAQLIDGVNVGIGRFFAWFALVIVIVQFFVVVGRYVFGIGEIWAQESITYMHAFMFMLAAAYTLQQDGHVRVDIFYREVSPRTKACINLFGAITFLIPVCILIVLMSWTYVANSWAMMEGSAETSGIQGVFLLKSAIIAFAIQMGLQGVSMAIHSILAIGGDESELDALRVAGVDH